MNDLNDLLAMRERIVNDLIDNMNAWLEEFNRVTDNMIKKSERLMREVEWPSQEECDR